MEHTCTGIRGERRVEDCYIPKARQISAFLEQRVLAQELTKDTLQHLVVEIAEEAGCIIGALWLNGANVAENGDYSTIYKPLTIRDVLGLRFKLFFMVKESF